MKVERPGKGKLKELDVDSWQEWIRDASEFPWSYPKTQVCYILAGRAQVTDFEGETIRFARGDLVTFEEGLLCTWKIREKIRLKYAFK